MKTERTLVAPRARGGASIPVAGRDPAGGRGRAPDRYELLGVLGKGGFATVWEAYDSLLERPVAIKVAMLESGREAERPMREAQAAARLSHPAIVSLYEAVETDGALWLVSELVRGRTLADLLGVRDCDDEHVVAIGLAVGAALAHAHERGVVHRDVKPSNVIVPADWLHAGEGIAAKLTDFGVATLTDVEALTRTGDVVGTFAYMAPEQFRGERCGAAADTYSLALILYEALSGVHPLRGRTPADTARRIGSKIAPLRRRRRDLPEPLCSTVDRALERAPARRASLAELCGALEQATELVAGRVPSPAPVAPTKRRRVPVTNDPAATAGPGPARGRFAYLASRFAAGVAAGALAGGALAQLGSRPPAAPLTAAALGALVVALAPAAGWIAAAAAIEVWLLAAGLGGEALLVAFAPASSILLLAGRPREWSVPALAPLLGWAGLAGVFVVAAARARTAARRALLGGTGALWVLIAEALTRQHLLAGPAATTATGSAWKHAPAVAVDRVLSPLFESGLLLYVPLWGAAAALLPLLLRGRSLALDLAGASAWSAAFALGAWEIQKRIVAPGDPAAIRGLWASAAVGCLAAVLLPVARARRGSRTAVA